MLKILIVDDHAVVRAGLKEILESAAGMTVAGEADTGGKALTAIASRRWDVVILDISLPDMSGIDVLKQAKAQNPELPILMLTIHPEKQYAVRAMRAGASGYLTKESAPDELVTAVRKVAHGGKYASSSFAEMLAFDLGPDAEPELHKKLSDREFQVLEMIASGKSKKAISQELNLSPKTISTYRRRILDKMGMETCAEIIRYAVENELID